MNNRGVVIRGPYDYDAVQNSLDNRFDSEQVSLTVQSSKDEADINVLVRRFGITGQMPQNVVPPTFQSFDEVFDYQTAQNALVQADRAFMQMPAEVRARFGNSPQEFVMFCSDEQNLDELIKLGLAVKKEEPPEAAPLKVEVVNQATPE